MKVKDGTRGMSDTDSRSVEALCIFLEDFPDVTEVDIEPMERGYKIRANKRSGEPKFSAFGSSIVDAINHLVRIAVA